MNLCQWCRGPEHSGACDREALKEEIRVLRLESQARQKLSGEGVIMITSLISHRNQHPRIDIQVGEIHTQMDAEHAMDVAINIIQCATGAYADAFIFNFLKDKLGQTDQVGVQIIQEFRKYRDELTAEFNEDQRV